MAEHIPIPEARAELYRLAKNHNMPALADQMFRKPYVRKVRAQSVKMTPEIGAAIRAYAVQYPDAKESAIGAFFRVEGGRVSEALNHKW